MYLRFFGFLCACHVKDLQASAIEAGDEIGNTLPFYNDVWSQHIIADGQRYWVDVDVGDMQ